MFLFSFSLLSLRLFSSYSTLQHRLPPQASLTTFLDLLLPPCYVTQMSLSSKYVPRVRMWKAPHENEAIQYCLAQGWDSRMLDGKAGRKLMYQALEDQAANPSIHGTFYKAYGGEIPNKKMEQFYKNFRRAISRFETTVAANDDSTRAKCRGVPTNNKMGPVDTPDKKSNADDLELTPKTQETKEASLASARKSQVAAERAILNQNAEKYVPLTTHTASVSMSSIQMSSSGVNASGKGPNDWCDPQNQKIQELVDSGDLTYDDVKHIAGNGKHNREASKLLNHIRHDYPELYGDFSATQFNENVRNMLFSIGKEVRHCHNCVFFFCSLSLFFPTKAVVLTTSLALHQNNTPMKSRTMETESEDSEEEMSLTTKRMKLVERNRRKASKKAEVHAKFFAENRSMFDEVGDRLGQTLEKFEDFGKHMNVISVHLGNLLDAVRQSIDLASKQLGELSALRQIAAASNERAHDLFHKQCQNQWAYEEAKLESEFAAEDLAEHEAREQYVVCLRLACIVLHIISSLLSLFLSTCFYFFVYSILLRAERKPRRPRTIHGTCLFCVFCVLYYNKIAPSLF